MQKRLSSRASKIERFKRKEFRKAYANSAIEQGLAYQIRSLRLAKEWSQKELADAIGAKSQSIVSRLEDPSYGKHSLQTLKKLSEAFDIALSVRFISFSQLIEQQEHLSPKDLAVPSFDDECQSILEWEANADAFTDEILHDIASSSKAGSEYVKGTTMSANGANNGFGNYEVNYVSD